MAGHVSGLRSQPRNEAEKQLYRSLDTYVIPEIGRTTREVMNGFSLTFAVFCSGSAWLAFLAARSSDGPLVRNATRALAVIFGAAVLIGLTHWFWAPNLFLGSAAVAFAAASLWPSARA